MRYLPSCALAVAVLLGATRAHAQQAEALWYMTASEESVQSFLAHADRISIVSPQVFALDGSGVIRGHVDPRVVAKAHEAGVKLVPLVMNPGFDQPTIHRVLNVAGSRRRAIANLAALCRTQHFDGIQFDIENVNVADKNALTSFMRESADSLHRAGCTASAAVVPRTSDSPGPTSFHKWIFENWRGVYDYKALADALDFISFMTYAQHTGGTTPGPVAGFPWMEDALKFVLSLGVPPAKVSLGVPAYSDWWFPAYDTKGGERMHGRDISYRKGLEILAGHGATAVWDDRQKAPSAVWDDDGVFEYMWLEDARAFQAKVALAAKYRLRGYSVWVLGLEDPAIWKPASAGAAPRLP